jgi:predicted AAA+ superfamily ATPase
MYPDIQIIATGSSSFDLSNKINEPLTGRIFEFTLLPLSVDEIKKVKKVDRKELDMFMVYGTYPAVVVADDESSKREILQNLATNYLYKDVFIFESIKNPRIFEQLVELLAHQAGNLISITELASSIGVSRGVVQRYLRLLEQSFIIKILYSYSTNQRSEIKKRMNTTPTQSIEVPHGTNFVCPCAGVELRGIYR